MALQKSASHNEQNKLSMGLAAVVVGILIVVIMVACFGLHQRLVKNRERIAGRGHRGIQEIYRDERIHRGSSPGETGPRLRRRSDL